MSKEKHLEARKELGLFFTERRKEMGHSCKAVADFIGITENTLQRIENGNLDFELSLLFRICEALEIKPFFVLNEQVNAFTDQIFGTNLN